MFVVLNPAEEVLKACICVRDVKPFQDLSGRICNAYTMCLTANIDTDSNLGVNYCNLLKGDETSSSCSRLLRRATILTDAHHPDRHTG